MPFDSLRAIDSQSELDAVCDTLVRSCTYLPVNELDSIRAAFKLALTAHSGQRRRSGEAYMFHPLAVAQKLADVRLDLPTLVAALLHDVVEDTPVTLQQVEQGFGPEVSALVDGVTKLGNIKLSGRQELAQAWNFQKLALATARDLRVILIKLADRLHNMETIESLPVNKRRRIAFETMEIYIPIANRLGIDDFRQALEELCLKAVYPMRYFMITKAVEKANKKNENYLELIRGELDSTLRQSGIDYRLLGRAKSIAGIYAKMAPRYSRWLGDKSEERRSFKQIMDIHAFRVLTDSVENCYRILGLLHQLFPPITGRFKDFIALPKSNGYQSLHTSLLGRGHPIEVQIRTEQMEEVANKGVAAHQLYKEANFRLSASGGNWFRNIQRWNSGANDPEDFVKHAKLDLYADEILVFSPKGDLYSLPKGATPVDFAYAIHTGLGNECVACKINDEPMPLNSKLDNGQRVEIITDVNSLPHPYWVNFVATSKALVGINEALRKQRRIDSEQLGSSLLQARLQMHNISLKKLAAEQLERVALKCGYTTWSLLLEEIGKGLASIERVVTEVADIVGLTDYESSRNALLIGGENLAVRYSSCCNPIPGDQIVAVSSKGKGIVIHRNLCHNISSHRKKHGDNIMLVDWHADIKGDFKALLRIHQDISPQIISLITTEITHLEGGIEHLSTDVKNVNLRVLDLSLSVKNRLHLANIMRRLRTIQGVQKIIRRMK